MMLMEKRYSPRVKTHIVIEMVVKGESRQYYGYIENLSQGGMGVISLDQIMPGTEVSTVFFIPDTRDKINPIAAVVHTKSNIDPHYGDRLNYHGFSFTELSEYERKVIERYVGQQMEIAGQSRLHTMRLQGLI